MVKAEEQHHHPADDEPDTAVETPSALRGALEKKRRSGEWELSLGEKKRDK